MHTFIAFPDDSPSFLNHNKSRRHLQKFGQDVTHIKTSFGVQMNTNAVERIHADVERRILLAQRFPCKCLHPKGQGHDLIVEDFDDGSSSYRRYQLAEYMENTRSFGIINDNSYQSPHSEMIETRAGSHKTRKHPANEWTQNGSMQHQPRMVNHNQVMNVGDYGRPHIGLNINEISLVGGQVTCLDDYRHRNILMVQPLIRVRKEGITERVRINAIMKFRITDLACNDDVFLGLGSGCGLGSVRSLDSGHGPGSTGCQLDSDWVVIAWIVDMDWIVVIDWVAHTDWIVDMDWVAYRADRRLPIIAIIIVGVRVTTVMYRYNDGIGLKAPICSGKYWIFKIFHRRCIDEKSLSIFDRAITADQEITMTRLVMAGWRMRGWDLQSVLMDVNRLKSLIEVHLQDLLDQPEYRHMGRLPLLTDGPQRSRIVFTNATLREICTEKMTRHPEVEKEGRLSKIDRTNSMVEIQRRIFSRRVIAMGATNLASGRMRVPSAISVSVRSAEWATLFVGF
ncbi:hypothetical protein EDD85DRAFT_942220 [Armillaria nabsnona]|nr:hypothetical protein EDD85DRAFT_942220 [Armillaria nabsnona]